MHIDLVQRRQPLMLLSRVGSGQAQGQSHTDTFFGTSQHQQLECVRSVQLVRIETWVRALAEAAQAENRLAGSPYWRRGFTAAKPESKCGDEAKIDEGKPDGRREYHKRRKHKFIVGMEITSNASLVIDQATKREGTKPRSCCRHSSQRF